MKVNVCSETKILNMKGEGVNTAFLNCIELINENKNDEVFINNEGVGDIMHSHSYGPYYFLRGLKYKGRKVFTVHVIPDSIKGSIPSANLLMPFVKWYFKQVYSYADVCIAISPMVEKVIKDLGVKTNIVVMNNPLMLNNWKRTPELREKGRAILGLKEYDFCVLGVGQLESRKGCADFIEVARQIPNAQFRWIGGRPFGKMTEGIKSLENQIAAASPNVKFSGLFSLEDMPSLYAAGDMFLFPSYQENCPLAPLEAAASGMPVVYRNIKEYDLLYNHEYLKADNNDEFVAAVNRLMVDDHAYIRGLEISSCLITQFEKNNIREKLMDVYADLLNAQTNSQLIEQYA
ncbi:MAG: glycosyltransferase family 4 protein [Bacteroidales bacterium]